jgi:Polyketide cyclase / dehydrase and lipid transport
LPQDFTIVSEIDVRCKTEDLFKFVTTPDNWVGTHPSTLAVKGETNAERKPGDEWIEVIEPPSGKHFEAKWTVVSEDRPRLWQIHSENFGGLPLSVRITYTLTSEKAGTHFRRDLVFTFHGDFPVDANLRAALSRREEHDEYLLRIKKRAEAAYL